MIIKTLSHPLLALIVSIAIAISATFSESSLNITVKIFAVLICMLLLTHVLISAYKYISNRRWIKYGSNFVLINVDHEWRITKNASLYMKSIYTIKNTGNISTRTIPFDNIGWFKKPNKSKISIDIPENETKKHSIKTSTNSFYEKLYSLFNKNIYFISWSLVVNPPLKPNQELTYVVNIYTEKTESSAFTDNGSYAGLPANFPIKNAHMKLIAPEGYNFNILQNNIVIDDSGEEVLDKEYSVNPDEISKGGGIVNWELCDLKSGVRYLFKYKFIKNISNV